jgi:hypothetical protein
MNDLSRLSGFEDWQESVVRILGCVYRNNPSVLIGDWDLYMWVDGQGWVEVDEREWSWEDVEVLD